MYINARLAAQRSFQLETNDARIPPHISWILSCLRTVRCERRLRSFERMFGTLTHAANKIIPIYKLEIDPQKHEVCDYEYSASQVSSMSGVPSKLYIRSTVEIACESSKKARNLLAACRLYTCRIA